MSAADMSDRPLSQKPDAVRKRQARAAGRSGGQTDVGGRGGGTPATKGNPLRPSDWSTMGEPLSPHEAERQLYWAHRGIAQALRSQADLDAMKEEFEVAGENYSFVANKMFPALRVMIRFVAPVVLVAVLFSIWVTIIATTPWWNRLTQWWVNRAREQPEQQVYEQQPPAAPPAQPPAMSVVEGNGSPAQPSPSIPRRPAVVRRIGR